MNIGDINFLAVLIAALSFFAIGALWYSPLLFANTWMREAGLKKEEVEKANMAKVLGLSFLLSLLISFNLAAFLGPDAGLSWGISAGALAGAGWVAASIGILYLFESRSFTLFLINAGYFIFSFMVAGGIIGAWQ